MSLLDAILNLAGLLLWLMWRSPRLTALPSSPGINLAATLKPAGSRAAANRYPLLGLGLLLLVRAAFYWHIGSSVDWRPALRLGAVVLHFRSDYLSRMCLFSLLGFAQLWLVFHLNLFLLSAINRNLAATDPMQKWIDGQIGWFDRLPVTVKLLAPMIAGGLIWSILNPALTQLGILPKPRGPFHLLQESLVVGAGAWLSWKYLLVALLALHMLNTYLFMGNYSWWQFVNHSAQNLLRPLRVLPLRLGKIDLAPMAGMALVVLGAEAMTRGLATVFARLPFR